MWTRLERLASGRDWTGLESAAAELLAQGQDHPLLWRAHGIAQAMLGKGTASLLRAAQAGDGEARTWLGILQEFAAYPPALVKPGDLLAQMAFERLRRSRYMDYPAEVHIETAAVCNAACSFCPYPTMERKGEKMPDALIDKIIDDLTQIPRDLPFSISPFKVNDPFLDKRIYDVCARINARLPNARLRLFTNGTPLTAQVIDRIARIGNVIHLWVSVNEYEPEPYRRLMQLPFERTLAKLDALHARVGESFPHAVVLSRVCDGTARDSGFAEFVRRRYPKFSPFLIGAGNWSGQVELGMRRPVPTTGCIRWFEVSIMASGKVALCCMDGEGKHVIGDVARQSVLEIYNDPGYRKMRQFSPTRLAAAAPCDSCTY